MKIKKFISFLVLLGCKHEPEYITQAYSLMGSFSKEMVHTESLKACGIGGSFYGGDIKKFDMSFQIEGNPSLDEGRELFFRVLTNFSNKINSNLKVRPFLHAYPHNFDSIEISILFLNKGKFSAPLASIYNQKGKVFYNVYNPSADRLDTLHIETYEEAIKALEIKRNKDIDQRAYLI